MLSSAITFEKHGIAPFKKSLQNAMIRCTDSLSPARSPSASPRDIPETPEEKERRREAVKTRLKTALRNQASSYDTIKDALLQASRIECDDEIWFMMQEGKQRLDEFHDEMRKASIAEKMKQKAARDDDSDDEITAFDDVGRFFKMATAKFEDTAFVSAFENTADLITEKTKDTAGVITGKIDVATGLSQMAATRELSSLAQSAVGATGKGLTKLEADAQRVAGLAGAAAGLARFTKKRDGHAASAPSNSLSRSNLTSKEGNASTTPTQIATPLQEDEEDQDLVQERERQRKVQEMESVEIRKQQAETRKNDMERQEDMRKKEIERRKKRAEEIAKNDRELKMVLDWQPGTSSQARSIDPCCTGFKSWFCGTSERQPLNEMSGDAIFRQWPLLRAKASDHQEPDDQDHMRAGSLTVKLHNQQKRNCGCSTNATALDDCLFPTENAMTASEATAIRRT
eukprot:gnl/MRDRNA2_/MRDRNA2_30515_c0_seq1.p1 gnl/MRDRNA2_/MRDRNA2_30515_c0~~gnl/MRDRNA2_/MRDRNA2_30515_c0_seq1.p1  ORF type:complete len:457 (+),score=99.78 gnl/MRDRNA2_/MRDRNA2_30515_c0_seq1:237-1607(+)